MKYKSRTNIRKISSLQDLHSEKLRLKGELAKTEERITSDYHHIIDAFSFHNILNTVTQDIAVASSAFSKAFSFGKTLLGKVKKKKKKTHSGQQEEIKPGEQTDMQEATTELR
jgi:hypothetical protein